ncbi:YdcF family protein [Vibrio metschnikovii]|uniref:YdcF family protein n=2 Tax=Bacteria TaxID=2 RepID=A0A9X0R7M8_VIBME|nr:YdcF family protein [Vibrio metschnikovii]EKO3563896.1 YdcF family protein [Vibrio metschnikovii]EKO3589315.1 YdcF family protein [Vibrio metschnikovii]EKO3715933.1 YdcF family protein [Vibrio metschnikovii]EKO3735960.1 YdcF family protein [Vibrio metschnikovii]EKO3745986.1 YdcF family protein [Vibrio metschnikovii]
MSKRLYQHLETLWQFMQMGHELKPADVIVVPGSNDIRVAEVAADLYQRGLAPWVLFSGDKGRFTEDLFEYSEAETFAMVAKECGLPSSAILLETQATHSGENVHFSHRLLNQKGIQTQRLLIVHKPYMERRAFATFTKQWPAALTSLQVTSAGGDLFDYLTEALTLDVVIHALLDDFQRLLDYPAQGFQVPQSIPDEVQQAYQALKRLF